MHTTNPEGARRLAAAVIAQAAKDLHSPDRQQRFESMKFFLDPRSPLDLWCSVLDRDTQRTRQAVLALLRDGSRLQ